MALFRWTVVAAALICGASGCDRGSSAPVPPPSMESEAVPSVVPRVASVPTCTGETPLEPGLPGSPGHLVDDAKNPNGASELALLMRELRDDLAKVRARVEAGEPAKIPFSHHRIRCAWPTVPADRNARFDAMAVRYLRAVDAFNQTGGRDAFEAVVQGCVDCHEGACTGALAAIRPLMLP